MNEELGEIGFAIGRLGNADAGVAESGALQLEPVRRTFQPTDHRAGLMICMTKIAREVFRLPKGIHRQTHLYSAPPVAEVGGDGIQSGMPLQRRRPQSNPLEHRFAYGLQFRGVFMRLQFGEQQPETNVGVLRFH